MLVLEGSDHLGKTNAALRMVQLAKTSCDATVLYAHMGRPSTHFQFRPEDYKKLMAPGLVCDRFHLGARIWHEDAMSEGRFQVIHSMLGAIGGFVMVFYTSDERWYRKHLAGSSEDQMFDDRTILRANRTYRNLFCGGGVPQLHPQFEESDLLAVSKTWKKEAVWNGGILSYDVGAGCFPSDDLLKKIVAQWLLRRQEAGTL